MRVQGYRLQVTSAQASQVGSPQYLYGIHPVPVNLNKIFQYTLIHNTLQLTSDNPSVVIYY